ncbi:MAG: protein kinase [Gemmataceae bacterium]|nr:protein kinase [Gemmataceae bacterium]
MIEMTRSLHNSRSLLSSIGADALAHLGKVMGDLTPLPPEERLDALLRDQAERWNAGAPIGAEFYRQAAPGLVDDDSLLLLVSGELRLRGQAGERLDPAEYASRFPQHSDTIGRQIEVEDAMQTEELSGHASLPRSATITVDRSERSRLPQIPGYEVIEELGRGGMGVVYKARQLGLNRVVALKTILPGKGASATMRARFQREAEHVAQLKHPGIVPVFAIGEHEGKVFFALEYVPGGSLASKLHAGKPWPALAAARFASQLATAMAYAHGKGIIHRDLKPGNILLGDEGQPLITDFGLARQAVSAGVTMEGAVVGTPAYMSPEQAKGDNDRIGPAADVFGLGAILYQMLAGRPPYSGTDARTTLRAAEQGRVVPVREANPSVPKGLARIVETALEPDLAKRYATAAELERALAKWLNPYPMWLVGLASAAALLLATGVALAVSYPWSRAKEPPQQHVIHNPGPKDSDPEPVEPAPKKDGADPAKEKGKEPAVPVLPLDGDFKLLVWSETEEGRKGKNITEKGAMPLRKGELIRFEATLNQPGHIYVVWIDGKGEYDAFYPWNREDPRRLEKPAPRTKPVTKVLMPPNLGTGFPLVGESGLETLLFMARKTPLPPNVKLREVLGELGPAPFHNAEEVVLRGFNRIDDDHPKRELLRSRLTEVVGGGRKRSLLETKRFDQMRGDRGAGLTAVKIDEPVLHMMQRASEHFEVVRSVRFALKGDDKP